jgi:hypothetical protein
VQAKSDAENLRSQLKEEQARHQEAKRTLLAEQQYFTDKIAELESLTKGATRRICFICACQRWSCAVQLRILTRMACRRGCGNARGRGT